MKNRISLIFQRKCHWHFNEEQNACITDISREIPLALYEQQNITDISREISLAFYEQQNITDISREISLAFYKKQNTKIWVKCTCNRNFNVIL